MPSAPTSARPRRATRSPCSTGSGADAVTVNPYPGGEAIAPLLERADRFAYVLCRTSNPEAAEFQNLVVAADPAIDAPGRAAPPARRPARRDVGPGRDGRARRRGDGARRAARDPGRRAGSRLPRARASAPRAARSSRSCATVRRPRRRPAPGTGRGLLVNVSRGISDAALGEPGPGRPSDPGERLAAAARDWASRLPVLP